MAQSDQQRPEVANKCHENTLIAPQPGHEVALPTNRDGGVRSSSSATAPDFGLGEWDRGGAPAAENARNNAPIATPDASRPQVDATVGLLLNARTERLIGTECDNQDRSATDASGGASAVDNMGNSSFRPPSQPPAAVLEFMTARNAAVALGELVRASDFEQVERAEQIADPAAKHFQQFIYPRFTLVAYMAEGSLGRVFLARDEENNGAFVAVKILKESFGPNALESAIGSMQRESAILSAIRRVKNPALLQGQFSPFDGRINKHNLLPHYAVELIEGREFKSIRAITADHGLSLVQGPRAELLAKFVPICEGVSDLHRAGIVHRDIKPGNIMIDDKVNPKVVDLGLAKRIAEPETDTLGQAKPLDALCGDELEQTGSFCFAAGAFSNSSRELTQTGAIKGTPLYMSPEQALGNPVDHRCDIYSLGATLFHLFIGDDANKGRTGLESVMNASKGLIEDPLEALETRLKNKSQHGPRFLTIDEKELCAVIRKAMALLPKDRYQSATEMADDIRAIQQRGDVQAYKEGLVDGHAVSDYLRLKWELAHPEALKAEKQAQRARLVWGRLALLASLVVGIGGYF